MSGCACGGFARKESSERDGFVLSWLYCGSCGRCDRFKLKAAGVRLADGEVARRLFHDDAMTDLLRARAKRYIQERESGEVVADIALGDGDSICVSIHRTGGRQRVDIRLRQLANACQEHLPARLMSTGQGFSMPMELLPDLLSALQSADQSRTIGDPLREHYVAEQGGHR